ncbi:hypothetical protein RCL1_006560 [Eukaryota sp. TZLM3-RCL]
MPFSFNAFSSLRNIADLPSRKFQASEDTMTRATAAFSVLSTTQEELSRFYCVSQSTVSRWLRKGLDPNYTHGKRKSGKSFSLEEELELINSVSEQPLLFLREVQDVAKQLFDKTTI